MHTSLRALVITAFSAALAQDDIDYTNKFEWDEWYSDNYAVAPYEIDQGEWALLMRQSVARGEHTFQGPDISRPYPTGNLEDMKDIDWALRVDIATNISLEFLPNEENAFNSDDYVSGGVLSLAPTEGDWEDDLDETFYPDPSWKICLYHPVIKTLWQPHDQKNTNGKDECSKILPDECISAFRRELIELMSYNSSESPDDSDSCPRLESFSLPDPCPSMDDEYALTWNWTVFHMKHAQQDENGTYPLLGPWNFSEDVEDEVSDSEYAPDRSEPPPYKNGSAIFQWASLGGDAGNVTQLEEIGFTTPVFIAFGINSTWINENAEDDYTEGNALSPQVEFICGQATEPTVDYLDEVPESSAVLRTGITGWVVSLMAVGVAMALA